MLIGYIISDHVIIDGGKRESAATRRYKTAGATATHRACDTCIMRLPFVGHVSRDAKHALAACVVVECRGEERDKKERRDRERNYVRRMDVLLSWLESTVTEENAITRVR